MSNYSLQKYKGTATRHTCPNCGDKRSFTCYVDESGMPLHPSVGRCNHESSCGYHYTPKEYFHDHPECRTANGFSFGRQRSERKPVQIPPQATIGYIPPKYVERSQSVHSNFFRFISS
ncbi:PG0870-related protein, partial [Bacteroides caccae]